MTEVMDHKPKPRTAKRKKIFRRLLLCALIAAIAFFIARVVRVWTGKPVIAVDYVAQLNKLTKPQNYDPNQNAAPYYEQALAAFVKPRHDIETLQSAWPADLNQPQLNKLKQYIKDNTKSIALLREALAKPYFWAEYPTPDNGVWGLRLFEPLSNGQLRRLLCLRAKLIAAEGRIEDALDDVYNSYRMGLQLSRSPTWLMQAIGSNIEETACKTAFEIIARCDLSPEQLTRVRKRFEQLMAMPEAVFSLDSEKLGLRDIAQRLFTDDGNGSGHLILPQLYKLERNFKYFRFEYGQAPNQNSGSNWLADIFGIEQDDTGQLHKRIRRTWLAITGPGRRESWAQAEKYYAKLEGLGNPAPWELHNLDIESTDDVLNISDNNVLKEFLHGPWLTSLKARRHGTKAALLTVLGILRYKLDKGELPDNLQSLLQAGYIKGLPRDPYDPGPLTYLRKEDYFVLYSFGPDFDDDGSKKGDLIYWPVENGKKN